VTRVYLSHLPPAVRERLQAQLDETTPAPAKRKHRVRGLALICGSRGERLEEPAESAIDRHGCTGRYSCDLGAG